MGIKTEESQQLYEPAIALGAANHFEVMGYTIMEPHEQEPWLKIICAAGNREGEAIEWIRTWEVEVRGEQLSEVVTAKTTGRTIREENKCALYDLLVRLGEFPAGTLE